MPPDLSPPPCPERKKIKLREISKPKTPPVEIQSKVAPPVVASAPSNNDTQLNFEESPKSKTQNKINEYEIVSIETCNEPEMPTSTKNDKKSEIYPPGKSDSRKFINILVLVISMCLKKAFKFIVDQYMVGATVDRAIPFSFPTPPPSMIHHHPFENGFPVPYQTPVVNNESLKQG